MKIPFDIKYRPQIESGEYKVVTRRGETVRIERWDGKDDANPIDAFIWHKDEWNGPWHWHSNGLYKTEKSKDAFDLFIITPEPELTEFEKGVRQVVVSTLSGETPNGSGGTMSWAVALSDDDVKKLAPRLLELAKKELLGQWNEDMKNEYARGKRDGITIGYNKAMEEYNESVAYHYQTYQPPCFNGGVCINPMRDCINCPRQNSGTTINTSGNTKEE